MYLRVLAVLLFCSSFQLTAFAQNRQKFEHRVGVSVSSSDWIKASLISALNRELRQLTGVIVVEDGTDSMVTVVALEIESKSGVKTGIAASIVVLDEMDSEIDRFLIKHWLENVKDANAKKSMGYVLSNYEKVLYHGLVIVSQGNIDGLAKQIASAVDVEVIEGRRKFYYSNTK